MAQSDMQTRNLTQHVQHIEDKLDSLINLLRDDIEKIDDPHAEALFETSTEVLLGLKTAFEHFSERSEEAWR